MIRRRRHAVVAALPLLLWMPAALAAAPPPAVSDDVRKSVAAMKADGGFQFEIPPPPAPPPPPPQWLTGLLQWLSGPGQIFIQILFWLLVAAAVLFLLYLIVPGFRDVVDRLIHRGRRDAPDDPAQDWRPDAHQARNLLIEADNLAAEGRFGEAAHLLLERSIEDIIARRPGLIKPALTARAIAAMDELPDPARRAFGRIAAIVEIGHWARRPVDRAGWQAARDAYEEFAFGNHWRPPAPATAMSALAVPA